MGAVLRVVIEQIWSWALVGCLVPAAVGCSLEAAEAAGETAARNTCDNSSDCGSGVCRSGTCVAVSATVDALLVEVSMAVLGGGDATGARYLTTRYLSEVDSENGFAIELGDVALISGKVLPQGGAGTDCQFQFRPAGDDETVVVSGDDGSIPVVATLVPRERLLGIAPLSYSAPSVLVGARSESSNRFDTRVTPGVYDIYLVPPEVAVASCPVAPQLLLGQAIASGAVELTLPLPAARELALAVIVPNGAGRAWLRGWRVDMIDPETGYTLSTVSVLGEPTESDSGFTYDALLHYSPVWSLAENSYVGEGEELVRFRPPEGKTGPTVFLSRGSLELFMPGQAVVEQLADVSGTVSVEGIVEALDTGESVPATLAFVATDVAALPAGVLAAYSVDTQTDGEGRFSVDLVPGTYRVRVVPAAASCCVEPESGCPCPSEVELEWEVAGSPAVQAGRTVQLPQSIRFGGTVVAPGGARGLAGATFELVPAPVSVPPLERLLRGGVFAPRAASTLIGASGHFELAVDPGRYRMRVRAAQGSGFAWLVQPALEVTPPNSEMDLGTLTMPLPIAYHGRVSLPGDRADNGETVAAGALIRAYAFLNRERRLSNDPARASSVVAIGEARTDENGLFVLLLPDAIQTPLEPSQD